VLVIVQAVVVVELEALVPPALVVVVVAAPVAQVLPGHLLVQQHFMLAVVVAAVIWVALVEPEVLAVAEQADQEPDPVHQVLLALEVAVVGRHILILPLEQVEVE
jgi:hypothetical protein